jgi:hypothetical protein
MDTSPYYYYLDVISKWHTAISIENQWFLWFDLQSVNSIKQNIESVVNKFDTGKNGAGGWGLLDSTTKILLDDSNQLSVNNLIGCVFASDVTIPNDSIDIKHEGLDYGGYQAPAVASNRAPYKDLSITFRETNSSFVDFILRPWLVTVGYFGLIARNDKDPKKVKCTSLDISFIGKTGPYSNSIQRKIIRFFNVIPKNIGSYKSTYAGSGMQEISVDFAYDYYCVIDPTSKVQTVLSNTSSNETATNPNPSGLNVENKNPNNSNQNPIVSNQSPLTYQQQTPNLVNPLVYQPTGLSELPKPNLSNASILPDGSFLSDQKTGSSLLNNPFTNINLTK